MSRMKFTDQLNATRLMVAGLRQNASDLPAGIDEAFINDLDALKTNIERLDERQEKLKAELKMLTGELDDKVAELKVKYAEARKRIKIDKPQKQWKEFGVEDRQ